MKRNILMLGAIVFGFVFFNFLDGTKVWLDQRCEPHGKWKYVRPGWAYGCEFTKWMARE